MYNELLEVLTTLARAITQNDNIWVTWGNDPCTDFKKIIIPPMDELPHVAGIPCSEGEQWLSRKALLYHEAGHVLFSSRKVMEKAKAEERYHPALPRFLNILEDARVERKIGMVFPGTRIPIKWLNNFLVEKRGERALPPFIAGPTALLEILLTGRTTIGKSAENKQVTLFLEKALPIAQRAVRAVKCSTVLKHAQKVTEIYEEIFGAESTPPLHAKEEITLGNSWGIKPQSAPEEPPPKEKAEGKARKKAGKVTCLEGEAEEAEEKEIKAVIEAAVKEIERIRDAEQAVKTIKSEAETSAGTAQRAILLKEVIKDSTQRNRKVIWFSLPHLPAEAFCFPENRVLISKTEKEIRKVLENRHDVYKKGQPRGIPDPSGLWKLACQDDTLFSKRVKGKQEDTAFLLLVDCSGSMVRVAGKGLSRQRDDTPYHTEAKIYKAAQAADLLIRVCGKLNIPCSCIGFSASFEEGDVWHFVVKDFNGQGNAFSLLTEENKTWLQDNADGISIRAVLPRLLNRPEKRKILFVISDGEPCAKLYSGQAAKHDTRIAVNEATANGVEVIGFYIGEGCSIPKEIYQNLIIIGGEDLPDLPVKIAANIRKAIV